MMKRGVFMNKVTVKIAGHEYTITGDQKREYILQVASHVDEKLEQLRNSNPKLGSTMAAVLTAVNIADEYYNEVRKNGEMNRIIKEPVKELEQMKSRVSELEKELILKEQQIQLFDTIVVEFNEKIAQKEAEKEEIVRLLEKKDEELKEAEEIVNDSQNRLYDLQMKVVELEGKVGGQQ